MNRYGVGMLKLLGKGEIIFAYPAVKVDHKAFVAEAYFKDASYVAVENAGAVLAVA
ncbi:unknown [Ruminococcus sp. CAG:382]|nr:unknown [Ruminococcus sp. CAG:382]